MGTSYRESVQTWGWGWATRDCSRNDDSRDSPVTVAVATVKRSVYLTAGCFQWRHCGLQVHGWCRASACSGLHLVVWTRHGARRRRWGGCLGRALPLGVVTGFTERSEAVWGEGNWRISSSEGICMSSSSQKCKGTNPEWQRQNYQHHDQKVRNPNKTNQTNKKNRKTKQKTLKGPSSVGIIKART